MRDSSSGREEYFPCLLGGLRPFRLRLLALFAKLLVSQFAIRKRVRRDVDQCGVYSGGNPRVRVRVSGVAAGEKGLWQSGVPSFFLYRPALSFTFRSLALCFGNLSGKPGKAAATVAGIQIRLRQFE